MTAPVKMTGCACGCEGAHDPACIRNKPVPTLKGCGGCQSLSSEEIAYCSRNGYYCGTAPASCALRSMLGGVA